MVLLFPYIHAGGRIGVLVDVETSVVNDAVKRDGQEHRYADRSSESEIHQP